MVGGIVIRLIKANATGLVNGQHVAQTTCKANINTITEAADALVIGGCIDISIVLGGYTSARLKLKKTNFF